MTPDDLTKAVCEFVNVENHLLGNSLHRGRVLNLLLRKLGFSIDRFVNTASCLVTLSALDTFFFKLAT